MSQEPPVVKYLLSGIKTEQFATFEDEFQAGIPLQMNFQSDIKASPAAQMLGIFIRIDLIQAEKLILKIVVSCHFKIEPESWKALQIEQNQLLVPKDTYAHLAAITYSTMRGILFTKTENSFLPSVTLPLIDLTALIKNDLPISTSN